MNKTVFTGVQILDGGGALPFAGEVLVEGNRIARIARDGRKVPRAGARVVDGGGATLMPGLVEPHLHISYLDLARNEWLGEMPAEEHILETAKFAKRILDHGFTAGFSAAAGKPRADVVIRNAINAGDIPGPRLLAASPEMTVTGGLGDVRLMHLDRHTFAIVCDGPDGFRRTAREMCREGVDILKINPSGSDFLPHARARHTVMNEAEIEAVAEVARSREKRMAAHCRSAESVKLCLKHGVEAIYHATLIDEEARDLLEAAKDRVFVAPTLGLTWALLHEAEPWGITEAKATAVGIRREFEIGVENMKALHRRGVRVLPGGDYGFAWNPIGRNARDLEHFVKLLDFTPMQAILAATRQGAEIMHMAGEIGEVKEGHLADLLLVAGNPLADISILQDKDKLLAIMQDGRFHKDPGAGPAAARVAAE